ncbi:MAG: N(4)-(beta-N-acetylglucosaminyl)-L-asparaginase [Bacteroidales bacterium]|nr:N(4)-(beta-N-acetylglucosaminyl)-L-asparaginase [Bacteroidales bacterium]MCF8388140.1 N(4)-(beta-N-acetylglucosaminyl)-L-asparaginase [Bacteroidales bacterium]MCF8397950.1 N(4)-(beta-N-acetylglucosaminyl)-L-asparaginase [Bacteroidales bacterium]
MGNRRKFIRTAGLATLGAMSLPQMLKGRAKQYSGGPGNESSIPLVLSTWQHGLAANQAAWNVLSRHGSALDAVENGVMQTEADPGGQSVGLGGLPDRDGKVTLDACIMDHFGNCGSVCFLEGILHPVSVARLIMEQTPHVMLAGAGAQKFALENGFKITELLTGKSRKEWENWKRKSMYQPVINIENHDTIGMIALDEQGNLAGACTTSGIAFKMHGRVGDSPIIGAGLYVDGEIGAAVATGHGEMVMKTLGSFLVVENMRRGSSPLKACEEAVKRITEKVKDYEKGQVGFLAMDTKGNYGAYSIHKGFNFAIRNQEENELIDSESYLP